MKHKVAFVILYFGVLPEMFPLWFQSARNNKDFVFLVYSDNDWDDIAPNIIWKRVSLSEMKIRINNAVGMSANIQNAYKLCDLKPCYGDIFREELADYDWWGFCDIDLVFGNISGFITDQLLDDYDKIGIHGHCVLLKNTEKMRLMYKQPIGDEIPYKTILRSSENFSFDEGGVWRLWISCNLQSK